MVKKRSCVADTQNCCNFGVLNQHNSSNPTLMPADLPRHYGQSILSLSSSQILYEPERGGQVQNLGNCYQCQKKFDLSQDIYMYRDLGFCSLECRDAKIAIDMAGSTRASTIHK